MSDTLDDQAQIITKRVNDRIEAEWKSWSHWERDARLDMLAEEVIPAGWEWTAARGIGVPPSIVLLRYDPRRA